MKAFKKHILIFILILIGTYFGGIKGVEADNLNWYGVKVECIYMDGGAYSFSYVQVDDSSKWFGAYEPNVNRITYNLVGVDTTKSATSSSVSYINYPVPHISQLSNHKCEKFLRTGTITQKDDDGNKSTKTYYKFSDSEYVIFEPKDFETQETTWWSWFGSWSDIYKEFLAIDANSNGSTFELVSERYIITDLAGEPNYTLTYREKSDQATGSDNYAYIMVYDNAYLLKTKEKTTILETGKKHFSGISVNDKGEVVGIEDNDKICINNPEPFSTTDSTGVASHYYKYGQIRYEISTGECKGKYDREYILFNKGLGLGDSPDDELCDSIMPETSKILKKIIQIAQILVPVLMIALCGLDIGKIVVSGNIEEDLPKQKKKIIARMVVGVSFFFLPLVVMLTLDLLKESGSVEAEDVKSIECLFE